MWVPLTGQWSTVNFDWAKIESWWAGSGMDMGRVGPGQARHVASSSAATSPPGLRNSWARPMVDLNVRCRELNVVHGGPLAPPHPPLLAHGTTGAPSSAAAPPSTSPLHGRASAGDESLVPVPRRLNDGAQGLYGFARTLGTRRWGPGGGLECLGGLLVAVAARPVR
jgi:hypothetical protein